jgi:hypothetical protein
MIDLPYLAGFFDGEGSIGIYSNGQGHGRSLRVQLTQNCGPKVDQLFRLWAEEWGAGMSLMNRNGRRPAWNWQASGANACAFLRAIRPWLRLKADQADVAINWFELRPKIMRGVDGRILGKAEAQLQYDNSVAQRLKDMKKVAA